FKARHRLSGRCVALKNLRVPTAGGRAGQGLGTQDRDGDARVSRGLCHTPCPRVPVPRLMDVCASARSPHEAKVTLVFEHVEQELKTFLEKAPAPGLPPTPSRRDLMRQFLRALDFLHSQHIIHRHLKPQNVLGTAQGGRVWEGQEPRLPRGPDTCGVSQGAGGDAWEWEILGVWGAGWDWEWEMRQWVTG
uniref:cyclin-dependent kinase n=1 Tax=Catharus ustulatus TaxID=91951 RepID=A0A8C3UU17_CATUS